MNPLGRSILIILFLFLTACSQSMELVWVSGVGNTVSGKFAVTPADALTTQSTCSEKKATLYALSSDGEVQLTTPLATTLVNSDDSYKLTNLKTKGINTKAKKVSYLVRIEACGAVYSRPLTGHRDQDVTVGSSLIEKINSAKSENMKKLNELYTEDVEALVRTISTINASSVSQIYDTVLSDSSSKAHIQSLFNVNFEQVKELTPPDIISLKIPTSYAERSQAEFAVTASHWYKNYVNACEWQLDGVTVSQDSAYSFVPGKNSQGAHTLTLKVGADDGNGNIDPSRPQNTQQISFSIPDTYPATVPALSLLSASPTNSLAVDLSLATGAGLAHCESFSGLSMTENSYYAPLNPEAYVITCASPDAQLFRYDLSPGDGLKTLNLWAMDASGQVASSSQSVSILLDQTAPNISLGSLTGPLAGGVSYSLNFDLSDNTSGVANATLYYAEDGVNYVSLADITGLSSYLWTVPAANTSAAKLKIIATDRAGNSNSTLSNSFTIDSNRPAAPMAALTSASVTNSTTVSLNIGCLSDHAKILISESSAPPATDDIAWQDCTSSVSFDISNDGLHSLKVWGKDAAGNISATATTIQVTLDQTLPFINLTSPQVMKGDASTGQISWTLTEANTASTQFVLELFDGSVWNQIATVAANPGSNTNTSYSASGVAIPALNTTSAKVRIKYTDSAGNSTDVQSSEFAIDSSAPAITPGSFVLNGNSYSTNSSTVTMQVSATDNLSGVSHLCLKFSPVSPLDSDSCWKALEIYGSSAGNNVTINNYYLLGFVPGLYNVYVWVKDAAGNQSSLSAGGAGTDNTDKFEITFSPPAPPIVTNVTALGTDTPSNPFTNSDLSVTTGANTIIKWKISSENSLASNPIALYYTTDDTNYNLITSGAANSASAGCTADGVLATGCYVWNVGSINGFFRIKVVAKDASSLTGSSTSNPVNTVTTLSVIAGTTDLGTGTSAAGALFIFNPTATVGPDAGSLVVQQNGTLFYRDHIRGVLRIKPTDGVQEVFLKVTGIASGDGGPVTTATLKNAAKLALDAQDRLLIYDGDRIRRVDFSSEPATISTVIGGGTETGDNVSPLNLKFTEVSKDNYRLLPLFSLPNGDIYFQSDLHKDAITDGACYRRYDAGSNLVKKICPTGQGYYGNTTAVWGLTNKLASFGLIYNLNTSAIAQMLFEPTYHVIGDIHTAPAQLNPLTYGTNGIYPAPPDNTGGHHGGFIQGMDGNLYAVSPLRRKIYKYNPATLNWTAIYGNGTLGECEDGTAATACANAVKDVFIAKTGQIYVVDKNLIRTVDSAGKVLTLMGRRLSYGDGGPATAALFNQLVSLDKDSSGRFTVLDGSEYRLREFTIGGNIQLLAGNGRSGVPAVAVDPKTTGLTGTSRHMVEPSSGDIYMSVGTKVVKLNRSTGLFENFWGHGTTPYYSETADGGTGASILGVGYPFPIMGFDGTNFLINPNRFDGFTSTFKDHFYKLVHKTTGTQSAFGGVAGTVTSTAGVLCANGTNLTSCQMPGSNGTNPDLVWDSANSRWLWIGSPNGNSVRTITAGVIGTLVTLPHTPGALAYRSSGGFNYLYYCSSGRLYKYNLNTSTETMLNWPISSMSCTNGRLIYDSGRDSLFSIFTQNGLYGVFEYRAL